MQNVVLSALLVAWLPTAVLSQERRVLETAPGSPAMVPATAAAGTPVVAAPPSEEAPMEARLVRATAPLAPAEPASAIQPASDVGRFLYNVALGVAITVISTLILRAIL